MAQYNTLNVKLSNSQLNKLKSEIKVETETGTQVSKLLKAFANGSSANIKFSKTRLSKMIQSRAFLTDISVYY